MQTLVVRHKVGDIDAWLNGHLDRVELFAPAASILHTYQDSDDPKSVVIVMEVTDMDKLQEIIKDPNNDQVKARHTVLEPIIISLPVKL